MKNYYYVLGVSKNARLDEIKSAFRKLSKKFHPDVNSNDKFFEERFKDIIEAYEILSDDTKKKQYDNLLRKKEDSSVQNIEKLRRDLEDQIKKFEAERAQARADAQKEREDFQKQKEEFFKPKSKFKNIKHHQKINFKTSFLILLLVCLLLLLSPKIFNLRKASTKETLYWSKCDQLQYHTSSDCYLIKSCYIQTIDSNKVDLWELTYHKCMVSN